MDSDSSEDSRSASSSDAGEDEEDEQHDYDDYDESEEEEEEEAEEEEEVRSGVSASDVEMYLAVIAEATVAELRDILHDEGLTLLPVRLAMSSPPPPPRPADLRCVYR